MNSVRAALFLSLAGAGLVLALEGPACAQSTPTQEGLIKLELQRAPGLEVGTVAGAEGKVDRAGLRFIVGGLSVLQPVAVVLLAQNPEDDLRLALAKYDRTAPELTGSTRGEGQVTLRFRTEGAVEIDVRSADELHPFTLVAWAGDEVAPEIGNVLVSPDRYRGGAAGASEYGRKNGGSRPFKFVALIALLLVVVILAGGQLLRHRRVH